MKIYLIMVLLVASTAVNAASRTDAFFSPGSRAEKDVLLDRQLQTARLFSLARIEPWKTILIVGDTTGYYERTLKAFSKLAPENSRGPIIATDAANVDKYQDVDVIINVAKDFERQQPEAFLTRSYLALNEGGTLVIVNQGGEKKEKNIDTKENIVNLVGLVGFRAVSVVKNEASTENVSKEKNKQASHFGDKSTENNTEQYFISAVKRSKITVADYIGW